MEFGQDTYRKFVLPALGVLETVATRGRSPGTTALSQEEMFRGVAEERAREKAAEKEDFYKSEVNRRADSELKLRLDKEDREFVQRQAAIKRAAGIAAIPDEKERTAAARQMFAEENPDMFTQKTAFPSIGIDDIVHRAERVGEVGDKFARDREERAAAQRAKDAAAEEERKRGKPRDLTPHEIEKVTEKANKLANVQDLVVRFKPEYTGIGTSISNFTGKFTGSNADQVGWWQDYSSLVNQVRNDIFGASLTPGEKSEFKKTIVTEEMNPKIAAQNLARQSKILSDAMRRSVSVYTAGNVNQKQLEAVTAGLDFSAPVDTADGSTETPTVPGRAPELQRALDHSAETANDSTWTPAKERRYQELLKRRGGG